MFKLDINEFIDKLIQIFSVRLPEQHSTHIDSSVSESEV